MAGPQPVICCGKSEQTGRGVIEALKPEYEVIHFIPTTAAGRAQIPLILSGKPAPADSELGTKNYARTPVAVLLGGGYNDEAAASIMEACAGVEGVKPVPWLRADTSKEAPAFGPEFGKAIARRVKERLKELEEDGQMGEEKVQWF